LSVLVLRVVRVPCPLRLYNLCYYSGILLF